jgi:hypothetical protein
VDRRDAQLFEVWGEIGELPLHANLRLVGEATSESPKGALPNNSVLLGFIWQPSVSNLSLDAGVRRGISRSAPDWQFTDGLTLGFSLSPSPGVTAFGGPAIMGRMQAELQDERH